MPFDIETSHASPSGATLHLYVTKAKAPPRGVIQINHGLAERAARYARFAETMAALGFHVYAHDHRGHGATVAPDAPPGIFGKPDGARESDRRRRRHPRPHRQGASGLAGYRLRPFDGLASSRSISC